MYITFPKQFFRLLLTLLFFCTTAPLAGEGFVAGTLVATPNGLRPIETITPNDLVISRTTFGDVVHAIVTNVVCRTTTTPAELIINGTHYITDKNQQFYLANRDSWCAAHGLKYKDTITGANGDSFEVAQIRTLQDQQTTLYTLSIAQYHNFCVGEDALIAHNTSFCITTVQTTPFLVVSGSSLALSPPAIAAIGGAALIGSGIYFLISTIQKHNQCSIETNRNNPRLKAQSASYESTPTNNPCPYPSPQTPNENDNEDKEYFKNQTLTTANKLGFKKTKYYSRGQPIFQKGRRFITRDVDSHNGGFWKMADSIENLANKSTRMGTYDQFLNRIGN